VKRARTVAIWALALALFAGNEWTEQRAQARAEARLGRDVAAVEAAARRTTYDEVSKAWTDLKLDRGTRLFDIKARVPVRWGITYEDEGAIILVYRSEGTCIDLLVRPTANTVRTREC
jgi:hypothetical protein